MPSQFGTSKSTAYKLIANMAAIDKAATVEHGIPALTLMENAGKAVADNALNWLKALPIPANARVTLLCGPGNNGGDGFVCARYLIQAGVRHVHVYYPLMAEDRYSDEARHNLVQLKELQSQYSDFKLIALDPSHNWEQVVSKNPLPTLIIDALFGSGLNKLIQRPFADWIAWANICHSQGSRVISIDVPSGLDSETGEILGSIIEADLTITLATGKPGLYLDNARQYAGKIEVVDIGIPQVLIDNDPSVIFSASPSFVTMGVPKRSNIAHKYQMGHVVVIAGSKNMPGAARLAAEAALTSGTGVVTLAAPESVFSAIELPPELLRIPLSETSDGCLSSSALPDIQALLLKNTDNPPTVLLGPGLGQSEKTQTAIDSLIGWLHEHFQGRIVLDADALNILAKSQNKTSLSHRFVLTPHIGEAGRLMASSGKSLDSNSRFDLAKALSTAYQAVIVLKSASTIITDGQSFFINPTGNNGMATAGSGDVLAGIISGLLAQSSAKNIFKLPEANPVVSGVYLHGLSGDFAAQELGTRSVRASSLIQYLPKAFLHLGLT